MSQEIIQSHSYQHFADLQLSANEFYAAVEKLIGEYQYPDVKCKRETLKEAGLFSGKREYLRVSKDADHYYVCASPFGKSFFISWWLKEKEDALKAAADKIPLFGKLISGSNRPKTFYEMDSELMFSNSINAIIKIAVDKVKADHGYKESATLSA